MNINKLVNGYKPMECNFEIPQYTKKGNNVIDKKSVIAHQNTLNAYISIDINGEYDKPDPPKSLILSTFPKIMNLNYVKGIQSRFIKIVYNGDCPTIDTNNTNNKNNTKPGLSALPISPTEEKNAYGQKTKVYESEDKNQFYFWMSTLIQEIPVFIVPPYSMPSNDGMKALGCYIPFSDFNHPIIFVCEENIKKCVDDNKKNNKLEWNLTYEQLTLVVLLHEFAHAIMDECFSINTEADANRFTANISHGGNYAWNDLSQDGQNIEEAYANAIMLKYLEKDENNTLFKKAKKFVKTQSNGYNAGEKFMDYPTTEDTKLDELWWRKWVKCKRNGEEMLNSFINDTKAKL